MPDEIIGRCRCLGGCERDVYRDAAGRQYVVADNGEHVVGDWLPPEEADDSDDSGESIVVPARSP